MRADFPRTREEFFVPHETTIILPDGRELTVCGIPYEGWGTAPGMYGYLFDYEDTENGEFTFSSQISWRVKA